MGLAQRHIPRISGAGQQCETVAHFAAPDRNCITVVGFGWDVIRGGVEVILTWIVLVIVAVVVVSNNNSGSTGTGLPNATYQRS